MRVPFVMQLSVWLAIAPAILGSAQQDPSLQTPESFPRFAPVAPADAERTFVVQHGFQMQLIAAEPLVTDPVAMVIDELGRAFVVEMNDYPYTDAKTHRAWQDNETDQAIGRVRMLEDIDGDGRYDRSTVFAEGLSWPSGVACYRQGLIVTATPDIWYLKDNDGDGRADQRERIFSGFRKYNVQAVMNNPIWGLDNQIYVAGSSNGGSVLRPGQSQGKPIAVRGDFRFDPDSLELELQAGGARFGNAFDDWGNRFLCNIRNPAIHVVMDNRYLARNRFYAAPAALNNIADAGDQMPVYRISPIEPWRELRGKQWSADPTKKVPRSELTGGGVFTSTSGICVYRGNAYPQSMRGQMIVAEVANNVLYRQSVARQGNTFRASRADQQAEFVASTDTWFRPVNLYNAPDGTLYVLDMYREFIEHPWSIPDDIHARLDLTSGRDRGRIYRLAPPDYHPAPPPRPQMMDDRQLVAWLAHENSWQRETAQRLLVERRAIGTANLLRELVTGDSPRAALHALWTLQGIQQLVSGDLVRALGHPDAHVREHAIRLAEPFLSDDARLQALVENCAMDQDSRVRLQLALSLGSLPNDNVAEVMVVLAKRDAADPWMRTALCSAKPEVTSHLLMLLIDSPTLFLDGEGMQQLVHDLAQQQLAATQPSDMVGHFEAWSRRRIADGQSPLQDALWTGWFDGLVRRNQSFHDAVKAERPGGPDAGSTSLELDGSLARDAAQTLGARRAAIVRMTLADPQSAVPKLAELSDASTDPAVATWALKAILSYRSPEVAGPLLDRLRTMSPQVREELLSAMTVRPDRAMKLLDAVASGRVPPAMLGLTRRTQLLASSHPQVKQRASEVLGTIELARATAVAKATEDVVHLGGLQRANPTRGRAIFQQHCAACHRAAEMGVDIGPHMETVRMWSPDKLILNILDPNREIAPEAMAYSLALATGSVISGMIAEETSTSLVVKRPGVPGETILRDQIEQMTNTGLSLMPVGFEELISSEQLADLIAFLKQ